MYSLSDADITDVAKVAFCTNIFSFRLILEPFHQVSEKFWRKWNFIQLEDILQFIINYQFLNDK